MQISHRHKFIFVHIYKVAGSSIDEAIKEVAFNPNHLLVDKVLRKLRLHGLPFYRYRNLHRHMTAQEIKGILPASIFNTYYKFGFVRNPWDWQVSLYHWTLETPEHYQHKLFKSMAGFDEYIRWRVAPENKVLQKSFLMDQDENLLVDFVGRFETLEKDFKKVCERVKITTYLPHINKSTHRDYQTYYDANSRELVREHFAPDINYFGYDFDGET
jgi:hypothetical protein